MIHHTISEEHGHILDVLTNAENTLRLTVSRSGAEPVSIAVKAEDGTWRGFLFRDGDVTKNPDGWNNHSTVMGYYIHRILNGVTYYRGHEIKGSTHSFLRHKEFDAPTLDADAATYHFSAKRIEENEYPFQVDFSICYQLSASELTVIFKFENREDQLAHVSFGLHPGFGITSFNDAKILLPPGRYTRYLAPDNFLSGETLTLDFPGGPMPFATSDLPGSFLLDLAEVPNRTFIVFDPPTGRRTTLDFSEVPYLTLWSDGHAYICVEPCWGLPDHHQQLPFDEKLGIQTIPAYGSLEKSFRIRPEILNQPKLTAQVEQHLGS